MTAPSRTSRSMPVPDQMQVGLARGPCTGAIEAPDLIGPEDASEAIRDCQTVPVGHSLY